MNNYGGKESMIDVLKWLRDAGMTPQRLRLAARHCEIAELLKRHGATK